MHTDDDSIENGLIPIVVALVLVQAGIATFAAIEVTLVAALGFGTVGVPVLLTIGGALTMLMSVRGLRRRRGPARRLVIAAEALMIAVGTVNLTLALLLTHQATELVPMLTHFVIPVGVIRVLRRPAVRAEFSQRRSRTMPAPLLVDGAP